jgi:hypothetical protein
MLGWWRGRHHLLTPISGEYIRSCSRRRKNMANNKDEVVLIGPSSPAMERGLAALTVHSLSSTTDESFFADHGDIGAIICGATLEAIPGTLMAHFSQARNPIEFRRRLRPHRRQVGRRARRCCDQYAKCSDRGGRGYGASPFALYCERYSTGRAVRTHG